MPRINEAEAANNFVERIKKGFYNYERSTNTEVVYQIEKEQRDTNAVKEFVNTEVFAKLKEME